MFSAGESSGIYLHIHGGGWVLGGCDMNDLAHEFMAREAGVTVVSVEYRLAPEHPYPAGLDDCVAAAKWLVDNCAEEFGTSALTIGGESAGANLVVGTLLRMRDEFDYTAWRGANLVYGAYTFDGTPSTRSWTERGLVLDELSMDWFNNHYLSGVEIDLHDPILSPLYADLTDMPPALFTVGTLDPLLDDSLFMATKWETAGRGPELCVYPRGRARIRCATHNDREHSASENARIHCGAHRWLRLCRRYHPIAVLGGVLGVPSIRNPLHAELKSPPEGATSVGLALVRSMLMTGSCDGGTP